MVSSVLVIDNDVAMSEILKAILEPKAFEVFTAHEVKAGIADVRRDIRTFSKIPILVLSAVNNPDAVARALDEGADDYLIKPVPSGVLIAHLKNLIRRSRAEQDAITTLNNSIGAAVDLD